MTYLEWNKSIWNYFFNEGLKDEKIVLAVNEEVLNIIGFSYEIENPIEDFIKAINDGPIEKDSNNIDKFHINGKIDFLTKAFKYIEEPNYSTNFLGRVIKIQRWIFDNHDDCLIIAYLAYLILVISSEENEKDSTYWQRVNQNLKIPTSGISQGYVPDLFLFMENWAKGKGFNFYYKNIYTRKKNVGTIYSQLPLIKNEEIQIIASLFSLKKEDDLEYSILKDSPTFELVEEFFESQKPFLNVATARELSDYSSQLRLVMLSYVFQNFSGYIKKSEDNDYQELLETVL